MASRDLIGRPLVPFFDADENVNAALQVDTSTGAQEQMEVDARVWNKELGYFEYPSEASGGRSGSSSTPIAIPARESNASADAGKTLLTPAMMLSSSCPETTSIAQGEHKMTSSASVPAGDGNASRSSSTKRGSRQKKGRSATPNARSQGKQSVDVTRPPGADGKNESGSDSSGNSGGGKKSRRKGQSGGGKGQSGGAQAKPKEELSASGKWAWSAFQSSPDPNQLPLPPFLTKPAASTTQTAATPPPHHGVPGPSAPAAASPFGHAPSQVPRPIPPFQPPLPPTPPPPEVPVSIELSMTQDLRRMLNIGGG